MSLRLWFLWRPYNLAGEQDANDGGRGCDEGHMCVPKNKGADDHENGTQKTKPPSNHSPYHLILVHLIKFRIRCCSEILKKMKVSYGRYGWIIQ
jgi:hypothetical protein